MDKKTFTIGVLAVTAALLLAANFLAVPRAEANFAVKDRDYSAVTARVAAGGEALYVVDNRTGMMGVWIYDPSGQNLKLVATGPMTSAFGSRVPAKGKP